MSNEKILQVLCILFDDPDVIAAAMDTLLLVRAGVVEARRVGNEIRFSAANESTRAGGSAPPLTVREILEYWSDGGQ